MRINHFVQADVPLQGGVGRFLMDTCGGRDQVAVEILKKGWKSYEAPMPGMISTWCEAFTPVFVDVGANTGFYSLLALASGAQFVHAFEPVDEIADIFADNLAISEMVDKAKIYRCAVGEQSGKDTLYFPLDGHGLVETYASLSKEFRSDHSAQRVVSVVALDAVLSNDDFKSGPVILKIDVESRESQVLRGAGEFLSAVKPVIFSEILPGSDPFGFVELCNQHGYKHYHLSRGGLKESEDFVASFEQRDHLFLPAEIEGQWMQKLN